MEECQICHCKHAQGDLFPIQMMRHTVIETAKKHHPDFPDKGYVCFKDLRYLRQMRIEELLKADRGALGSLDQEVLQSMRTQQVLSEDINKRFERELTFGERMADRVAQFGGSWPFIILFFVIVVGWMTLNKIMMGKPFDPYPFILLNLVLSCLAAIQAPVIMMSQNRLADKDRMRDTEDYCVNLKAELEIQQLHAKFDLFLKNQWETLLEIQQLQLDDVQQNQPEKEHPS